MPFSKLGLPAALVNGVKAMGYVDPTPIQLRAIPVVLGGGDLIGSAQTGTGKTAAFALPVLARLGKHEARGPRVLVLEPTRELAAQVETAFRDFGRYTDIRATVVHGGVGYGRQRSEIQAGTDIVIATPGRLMDFLSEGTLRLEGLQILILDEVDRMLDMGFVKDVKKIIGRCPKERQTLFFSATIPRSMARVICRRGRIRRHDPDFAQQTGDQFPSPQFHRGGLSLLAGPRLRSALSREGKPDRCQGADPLYLLGEK